MSAKVEEKGTKKAAPVASLTLFLGAMVLLAFGLTFGAYVIGSGMEWLGTGLLACYHSFFSTVLASVNTKSAGKGGSRVGDAIKTALRGFPGGPGAKLMVLISDGDDQDPYTQEAAKAARDQGVKIIAVGLGSETGSQITLTDPQTGAKTTLMYEGKPVISKLDGDSLRKIALTTEGAYVPAGTSAIDLDSIMESHVQPIVRAAAADAVRVIPAERYPWLVLASLGFLLAALWVRSLR